MICVLSGGTGGAKFVDGLRQAMPAEEITIVVNTGDDLLWWGLYVSPDIDSITYVLSGMLSRERGWGVKGDTFLCPAWTYHQHVNDGDEQAIILTVQDFPLMAAQRNLIFEEPRGADNIKLVSKKFVPHRDTAESFKLDI